MVTLKNPDGQIPNGLRFIQAETGWDSTKMIGKFPSMDTLTRGVITHRAGNPWLIQKHNWSTDYVEVQREMRDYNARLCLQHGWMNYIQTDEEAPERASAQKKTSFPWQVAAETVKRVSAGVGVLIDWLGSGGTPVAQEVAERRAGICADCPQNGKGGITSYFTQSIADKIRQQLEIRNDLQLKTSHDDRLGVCEACLCPLKLKTWVPLDYILDHTSDEVKAKLDPRCWITKPE